jgi:hypothetical protein
VQNIPRFHPTTIRSILTASPLSRQLNKTIEHINSAKSCNLLPNLIWEDKSNMQFANETMFLFEQYIYCYRNKQINYNNTKTFPSFEKRVKDLKMVPNS